MISRIDLCAPSRSLHRAREEESSQGSRTHSRSLDSERARGADSANGGAQCDD
jgi:hypothetical protein